jgi:hypothetical protein
MTIKQKVLNWCKRPFANHPFAFAQTPEEFEAQAKFIEYKQKYYKGYNLEQYVKFVREYAKEFLS